MPDAAVWPTLAETTETCPRCGETLTGAMIVARWSPTTFYVACRCSPQRWIQMVVPSQNGNYWTE
jgi:rRNA maturation protein Nop10